MDFELFPHFNNRSLIKKKLKSQENEIDRSINRRIGPPTFLQERPGQAKTYLNPSIPGNTRVRGLARLELFAVRNVPAQIIQRLLTPPIHDDTSTNTVVRLIDESPRENPRRESPASSTSW